MKKLSTNEWIGVTVAIVVIGFFFVFGSILINIFKTGSINSQPVTMQDSTQTNTASTTANITPDQTATAVSEAHLAANTKAPTGLGIRDVVVGTGEVAQPGETVTVHYVGTFTDGSVFDSSIARGTPFSFLLGGGQVIKGWDEGVAGMRVGGKRILTIPSSLGYGPNTYGPIPGGSTLVFQVELLGVKK